MSLVIGVISTDFAIVCGEGKVTYSNNTSADDFQKVFKLNGDILVGITGSLEGVHQFIGFLFEVIENRFVLKDSLRITYKDLKKKLDAAFDNIVKNNNCESFFVSILGWDSEFCIDSYFYNSESISSSKREHTTVDTENGFKFVCMESVKGKHYNVFLNIAQTNQVSNILQIKNAFKDTIDLGIKYDNTINSNYMFESIRKKDVIDN